MLSRVAELVDELASVVEEFDPALVHADDAARLVDVFVKGERACAAGKTQAAARAKEAHAWKREGFASAAAWLAHKQGTTKGRAVRTLELGDNLGRHERTREEFVSGRLSEDQAGIIASAAEENPQAEEALVQTASDETVQTLKQEAARARAEAADEEERQAKIHQRRYASGRTDEEGAYRFQSSHAAREGGIFDTIWQRFRERVARDAKRRGDRLTDGQIGADALVLMAQTALEAADGVSGAGSLLLPEVRLHLIVGHETFQTGELQAGERCELDGIGPIAPARAREFTRQGAFVTISTVDATGHVHRVAHLGTTDPTSLSREKVLDTLAREGVDVHDIELAGRAHVPEVLQTAMMIRDRRCAAPGCDRRHRLQTDHIKAVELGGSTSYWNLQRLCWHHHQAKTRRDMAKIRARKSRDREARAGPVR